MRLWLPITDRDAAVTGEREEALRLARKVIRDPMPGDGEVLELSRAFLAEAARADALEAENERLREELDEAEGKVREAQGVAVREWERNKEFRRQREDAHYAAALADDQAARSLSKPTEGSGDA